MALIKTDHADTARLHVRFEYVPPQKSDVPSDQIFSVNFQEAVPWKAIFPDPDER